MAVRIVIADDADLTIVGARTVLQQDHRYAVVGTARSMADLIPIVEQQHPDVVLLNEWIYNTDILSAVEQVKQLRPHARLLVMGVLVDGLLIRDLFACGVNGYLYKSDNLEDQLALAVDAVMRNRLYLSPTANAEYLVAMQSPERDWRLDGEARAVLRLLAQGCHVGQIALALNIPPLRVYSVREKLRRRFGAVTNEHMMSRAAAEGFVYPS